MLPCQFVSSYLSQEVSGRKKFLDGCLKENIKTSLASISNSFSMNFNSFSGEVYCLDKSFI